jgi:hypothetical protein
MGTMVWPYPGGFNMLILLRRGGHSATQGLRSYVILDDYGIAFGQRYCH